MNCRDAMVNYFDDCLSKRKSSSVEDINFCKARASAFFEACQLIEKWLANTDLTINDIVEILNWTRDSLIIGGQHIPPISSTDQFDPPKEG